MPEAWSEILKPGTIAEIRLVSEADYVTTYIILESRKENSLVEDGQHYECLVLNQKGEVHFCVFHENEIRGIAWYSSRKVKFLR